MSNFVEVVPDQLYIARGALTEEATALAAAIVEMPRELWPTKARGIGSDRVVGRTRIGVVEGCQHASGNDRPEFPSSELEGLDELAEHSIFMDPTRFQLIRQGAWFQQGFHRDVDVLTPIDSVQLSEDGGVEYERDGVMHLLKTDTGDTVRITDLSLIHRGLNLSRSVRYSLQFYRQIQDRLPVNVAV